MSPDATAGGPIGAIDAKTAPTAARRVLRVVVGSTLLAIDGAGSALQHIASELPAEAVPTGPLPPLSARHLVIGALAVGPAWVNERLHRLARRGRGAIAGVRRASAPLRFAARFLPTDELRRWSSAARSRAISTALGLAEVGRHEEPIARALARAAAANGLASVFDRIASSPQLQSLIREQSAGMGRSALSDLRSQGARADAAAESLVGQVLPQGRRNKSNAPGSR